MEYISFPFLFVERKSSVMLCKLQYNFCIELCVIWLLWVFSCVRWGFSCFATFWSHFFLSSWPLYCFHKCRQNRPWSYKLFFHNLRHMCSYNQWCLNYRWQLAWINNQSSSHHISMKLVRLNILPGQILILPGQINYFARAD